MRLVLSVVAGCVVSAWPPESRAAYLPATPEDYVAVVRALKPGDTVVLEPGEYNRGLRLVDLHGRPDQPITISGPVGSGRAVLVGRPGANTLEVSRCSWIVVRDLVFDGRDVADDAIKAKGTDQEPSHHVTIERNTILRHGRHQTFVAISTKAPCWDWVVRGNVIVTPGTGLYFGDSNGRDPFIRGVIEHNIVYAPKGYGCQVKQQSARPELADMPTDPSVTVIRYNTFVKDDRPGEQGRRPSVLVDGFPDVGPGSKDRYHIYGNVFLENPAESLLQVSGRVSIHDNLFVTSSSPAVAVQTHAGKRPQSVRIYHNTFVVKGAAVRTSGVPPQCEMVVAANLVASRWVRQGVCLRLAGNTYLSRADAEDVFGNVTPALGRLDLHPRDRFETRLPESLQRVLGEEMDWQRDFAGKIKNPPDYCGALSQPFAQYDPVPLPAALELLLGP